MNYLEMAKQAEAKLREAGGYERNEANAVSSVRATVPETFRVKFVNFVAEGRSFSSLAWPDALPGLGRRTIGSFDCCASCERRSWARYGGVVLCLPCAQAEAHNDGGRCDRQGARVPEGPGGR
jgi:hypothetical protein